MDLQRFIDAVLALPALGRILVSPEGRHVAWTWYRKAPAADVYVAPTDGSAPPRRLTATANDTQVISWAPDAESLVVAEDQGGDEHDQLFRLVLDGTITPLTESEPAYFMEGGEIDASGRYLVFAGNVDPETGRAIEASWVLRQDLAQGGGRRALARPLKPNSYVPRLDRKGTRVLYARRDLDPAGTQIWMVGLDGSNDREILNFGAAVKTSASWFPDSRRLAVLAERPTHKRLGVYDSEDQTLAWLVDDPNRAIEAAFVPKGSARIVAVAVDQARTRALMVDPASGGIDEIGTAEGTLLPIAPAADGGWIGRLYAARQPDTLVRFSCDGGRARLLGKVADPWAGGPLGPDDLAEAEDVRWRSVDGLEIQGWLYRPKGPSRGLIVQVHGGPTAHSEAALSAFIQSCCGAGFSVLDPNYRGSTGFGVGFREAIRKTGWGGLEQDDIRTGIEAMMARGRAEPGRVGITGTSYGGYSSWCAITRWPPEIVAAAAPICGMTDLVVDYETTRPDIRPYSEEMMGGSPRTVPERYRERSPIHFVDRIKGRLLIVQGANDPNVTPENVRVVEAALERAGVPYETLVFPDEGHGIRKPRNLRVLYTRLIDFFGAAFALPHR
jgi:dipeptidyl aminopeptidase/acylaminoacyl peptidase